MHTREDSETLRTWMRTALNTARRGIDQGQSPFGAAIASPDGKVISVAYNRVRAMLSPAAHAEVLAIESACKFHGALELKGHTLIATAEPCPICAATAATAGIANIVYGAHRRDVQRAGYETLHLGCRELIAQTPAEIHVTGGVLEADCLKLFS